MAETLLYAEIPEIVELCCLVAYINVTEIKDSSAKSHFHWKTMKCRLIINAMQDAVIASPVWETISSIHVITSVKFFESETLQNTLKEMNMTWSAPRPVTPDVYGNCLRYTIQFALAPRWNRVGQYVISDKYFLSAYSGTLAMRFNLTIQTGHEKKTKAALKLQPLKVKMDNLTVEDLKIPRDIMAYFMADPRGVIDVASLGTFRVTVLPSLKRGKLMRILKNIPASSPFKNYGELRRHWKNMYGYRLPEIDHDIIYYDILFPTATGDHFLYPDICVKSRVSESKYLGKVETIIRRFVQDLNERMPIVCGKSMNVVEKDYATKDLTLQLPKTPEMPSSLRAFHKNFDSTTRLSLSLDGNELCKQTSTLMSPTPSLRGSSDGQTNKNKIRNILMSFGRNPDAKSIRRLSRTKNYPSPVMRNGCSQGNPNDNEILGTDDSDQNEISSMNMVFQKSRYVVPGSSNSKIHDDDRESINPSNDVALASSCNDGTAKITKPKIINDAILSKYFITVSETNTEANDKSSPIVRTITLGQKLERNLSTTRKTSVRIPNFPDSAVSGNSMYNSLPSGSKNSRTPKKR